MKVTLRVRLHPQVRTEEREARQQAPPRSGALIVTTAEVSAEAADIKVSFVRIEQGF